MTFSWSIADRMIRHFVAQDRQRTARNQRLDDGQRASLLWIAERIQRDGVVLADEVGTGKTRIACAVVHAVLAAGGRAAVVVPHGLMHQWKAEANKLELAAPPPRELTTVLDLLQERANRGAEWQGPRPRSPEWWLISHGFRAPAVRSNSYSWRLALPSLVHCALKPKHKLRDQRTSWGALAAVMQEEQPNFTWSGLFDIAVNVARRLGQYGALKKRVKRFPPLNVKGNGSNDRLMEFFDGPDDGRRLTEELLGLWLGDFDLLVIDEAHKSRGSLDEEGEVLGAVDAKVLTRLVDGIIRQSGAGRRLCLTATPMELDLRQWLDLLGRARCGIDREKGQHAVQWLHDAARRAAVAPDEGARLDELCKAAREFTRVLSPYVTRRRRDEDKLVRRFRNGGKLSNGAPHPHRRLERVQIGWTEIVGTASPWIDVLFAAECMSHSARGLSLTDTAEWPKAVRDAYTKLSAGHVSLDLSETSEPLRVPGLGTVDEFTRGKIVRTAYWYRRLRDARRGVIDGVPSSLAAALNPDSEHPRILEAVKEIERWTSRREKVLVFGVFLQPLRLLRDVLNVRQALRSADEGLPIAHAIHTDPALFGIALRQIERMRADGSIRERLASGNGPALRRALADSHKTYENLRRRVRDSAKHPLAAWKAEPGLLGGARLDHELEAALQDHLVSFILDDFLVSRSRADQPTRKRIEALSQRFLEGLQPLLGELGDEDADIENQADLRQEALRAALVDDHDGRQSLHARLLQGATRWETRRYVQAAFNRVGASPRVLVAQSQVGREGLNLHEACRVVVQFHAEWNPAILEQQIGRVDRKGSRWEQMAKEWLDGGRKGKPPFIEVRQLVFEGTYDAFQWDRVMRRQHVFDASLFGSLLPADALNRVPADRISLLQAAAPSFRPPGS
jgi:Helicase conserved C-terminal domain